MTNTTKTTRQHIYTDGAAPNNQSGCKLGGAGVAILSSEGEVQKTISARVYPRQGEAYTTNNRCEMLALSVGLNLASGNDIIYCDNDMVVKGYNEWLETWKRKDWRNSQKKPTANKDIWLIIDRLKHDKPDVEVKWVRSHNGTAGNELADLLANQAIQRIR